MTTYKLSSNQTALDPALLNKYIQNAHSQDGAQSGLLGRRDPNIRVGNNRAYNPQTNQYYDAKYTSHGGMGGFGDFLKTAAPLALGFIPGVGPLAGAALGAGIGSLGGGGLKGALLGGAGGYLGAGGLGSLTGASGGTGGLSSIFSSAGNSALSGLNNAGFGNAAYSLADGQGIGSALSTLGSGSLGKVFGGGGLGSLGSLGSLASNIYSGVAGNNTTDKVLAAQQAANKKALNLQATQYGQTQSNINPFITSGQASNNTLSALLGLGGDSASAASALQADPGYQFRLQQGQQAMDRSLGAKGNLFSGQALKAAQDYGQGLASQSYNDLVSHLQNQSQQGLGAAENLGGQSQNYANEASGLYQDQGNATANALVNKNNNTNQSLANIFGTNVGSQFGGQSNNLSLLRMLGLA